MPYPALLAIHLLAVAIFAAVLLLTGLATPGLARPPIDTARQLEIARLRAMNLYAASPALAAVWACGLAMAAEGGWYAMGWLRLKVALVLILSAIHGRQMATLRALARGQDRTVGYGMVGVTIATLAVVVGLVVSKPF